MNQFFVMVLLMGVVVGGRMRMLQVRGWNPVYPAYRNVVQQPAAQPYPLQTFFNPYLQPILPQYFSTQQQAVAQPYSYPQQPDTQITDTF